MFRLGGLAGPCQDRLNEVKHQVGICAQADFCRVCRANTIMSRNREARLFLEFLLMIGTLQPSSRRWVRDGRWATMVRHPHDPFFWSHVQGRILPLKPVIVENLKLQVGILV